MKINRLSPILLRNQWTFTQLGRLFSDQPSASQTSFSSGSHGGTADVPGLSDRVLKVPSGKVGPGASKDSEYKNPEYFCYNQGSYFEAEIEMAKYRLPQPSAVSKN